MSNSNPKLVSGSAGSNLKKLSKHHPSSVREWNNSIYLYNKNALSLIPSATVYVMKIIKSYFNLFNHKLERKMRAKRLLLRFRKLSSNRIYFSHGEFKHTNNKVLINIYLFNRQKYNYLHRLKKLYLKKILSNKKKGINLKIIKKLRSVYKRGLDALKKSNNNKYTLIKTLNIIEKNPNYKISLFKNLSKSSSIVYNNILKKSMKRLSMYFYYKQLLYINKSKLNYRYLQQLKSQLETFYNKNVEFNLVNLKNIYLNSDIMSESVKLKLTRNRRRLLKLMNKIRDKVKIHKKPLFLEQSKTSKNESNIYDLRYNNVLLRNFVINHLKYKDVTGFRLEAKGRLTKRHTASRTISKVRYKGNLLNIDSSYRKLSSVMLKGNLKSNLQFSKNYSKTRVGSFGLKGWISGN